MWDIESNPEMTIVCPTSSGLIYGCIDERGRIKICDGCKEKEEKPRCIPNEKPVPRGRLICKVCSLEAKGCIPGSSLPAKPIGRSANHRGGSHSQWT